MLANIVSVIIIAAAIVGTYWLLYKVAQACHEMGEF